MGESKESQVKIGIYGTVTSGDSYYKGDYSIWMVKKLVIGKLSMPIWAYKIKSWMKVIRKKE